MATGEVTGKTLDELQELRSEFSEKPRAKWIDFGDYYCLAKIPKQPEEYDGPARYCASNRLVYGTSRCKYHGGASGGTPENLDPLANMKHGMNATRQNLFEDMDSEGNEWQMELYEWVTTEWPEAYDVDLENDPQAEYEFHALAVEIVRAERAEGFILREGEDNQKKIFGPDGSVHYEDIPHYLSDMIQRQRKLIMTMEDNLGISRKKRLQNEQAQDATDVLKSFAEVGASLITESDTEFDPCAWDPDDA